MEELAGSPAADLCAARRNLLREIFREVLDAIDVREVFARAVRVEDGSLRVDGLEYELGSFRRVLVIAIGKAAVPSAEAVLDRLSGCGSEIQAMIVGPGEPLRRAGAVEHWPGSHPVPDANAREAARRIVALLSKTDERDLILFLISGGASAMVELPLDPEITEDDAVAFYRALVHSGLGITEMNALRKHVSAVKGGRLAQLAPDAAKCTLLISDVPEGKLDVIGSGPTLPDSSTREECRELLLRSELTGRLPRSILSLLESADLPETPKHDAACFRRSEARVLLSSETMLEAAAQFCRARGYAAVVDNTCDEWDYRAAADFLLERVRELLREHPRVCVLSGGELAVPIGDAAGTGGRNQQFALYCATRLDSIDAQIAVLSAGTDGVDGNSSAAGAVVDQSTVARAKLLGLDAQAALEGFDASPLLMRLGDAIVTGPTGNNVRDLRIVMAERGSGSTSARD